MVTMPSKSREGNSPTASEKFFQYFHTQVADVKTQIDQLSSHGTTGGERRDATDHCLASISQLSREVAAAASYVPAYDQRTYGETIKALEAKLRQTREELEPKGKFRFGGASRESFFKIKKNESAISVAEAGSRTCMDEEGLDVTEGSLTTSTSTSPPPVGSVNNTRGWEARSAKSASVAVSNHDGIHIILPATTAHATSSGTLSLLTRCVVDMSSPTRTAQPLAALILKSIRYSLIVGVEVSGATHLTRLQHCVVVLSSGQFRLHESRDCDIYLSAGSQPIIEDCKGIRFAPLPECYSNRDEKEEMPQPGRGELWKQVQDFGWLRQQQSPNWRVLPEEERIKGDVWSGVVRGGPNVGTEDILKAVGLGVK